MEFIKCINNSSNENFQDKLMTDLPTLANDSGWLLIWNDIKDLGPSFGHF